MRIAKVSTLLIITAAFSASAHAAASLSFDGLQNGEQILNYYNGGLGGNGSGPGPNDGITFSNGIAASSTTIAYGPSAVLTATSVTMNLANPFSGDLSFYFANTGSISLYSGLNGTGTQVFTRSLIPMNGFPFGATPPQFQSAVFTGIGLRLDSVSLGTGFVLPEPTRATLIIGGLALLAFRRLRAR